MVVCRRTVETPLLGCGQHPKKRVLQMPVTPAERRLIASAAAAQGWANTVDRAARGRHGQKGLFAKYLAEVPDEITDPAARRKNAESRMRAHYARMAYRSAKVRRERKEAEQQQADELKSKRANKTRAVVDMT
jgi:hypothetical protein